MRKGRQKKKRSLSWGPTDIQGKGSTIPLTGKTKNKNIDMASRGTWGKNKEADTHQVGDLR